MVKSSMNRCPRTFSLTEALYTGPQASGGAATSHWTRRCIYLHRCSPCASKPYILQRCFGTRNGTFENEKDLTENGDQRSPSEYSGSDEFSVRPENQTTSSKAPSADVEAEASPTALTQDEVTNALPSNTTFEKKQTEDSSSVWNDIFSGIDPHPKVTTSRAMRPHPARNSGNANKSVPRSVLFAKSHGKTNNNEEVRFTKTTNSGGHRSRRALDRTPLTPSEADAFQEIFQRIWGRTGGSSFSRDTSESSNTPIASDYSAGKVGQTVGKSNPNDLFAFLDRNRARSSVRFGKELENVAARKKSRSRMGAFAILREGAAAQMKPEEMEQGIDSAKQEMTLCETVGELWEWACINVWGNSEQTKKSDKVTSTNLEESVAFQSKPSTESPIQENSMQVERTANSNNTTISPVSTRYGMHTPFYAPVLHALFLTLRERFRSPHTALAVLRVTRTVSPESLVLGCTPYLYAEAIRTYWYCFHDVRGARDTLKDAREIGLLSTGMNSGSNSARSGGSGLFSSSETLNFQSLDDKPIRDVVERLRDEVRQRILVSKATALNPVSSTASADCDTMPNLGTVNSKYSLDQAVPIIYGAAPPLLVSETLDIVKEMGSLVGKNFPNQSRGSIYRKKR